MARESVQLRGLDGVLRTLQQLPAELVSKGGGPVRTALYRAAQVLHAEARRNLQAIIATPNADGDTRRNTGLLEKNLIIRRGRLPRSVRGERMAVAIRRKSYAVPGATKPVTTTKVAALLEQATARRQAYPFLRPAYEVKRAEAVQIFERELPAAIARIVKRLERENRVA